MASYKITVREIRSCEIEVEANSYEEALAAAETEYNDNLPDYDAILEIEDTTFE